MATYKVTLGWLGGFRHRQTVIDTNREGGRPLSAVGVA